MLGVLILASKGSLVVTSLAEVFMRILVVEALAAPLPWLRMVKLTVPLEPAAPLDGFTARFWIIRSDLFVDEEVMVNKSLPVPVPAGVVTLISLEPVVAVELMEILAVIWVELFTAKLLTVIPAPKLI